MNANRFTGPASAVLPERIELTKLSKRNSCLASRPPSSASSAPASPGFYFTNFDAADVSLHRHACHSKKGLMESRAACFVKESKVGAIRPCPHLIKDNNNKVLFQNQNKRYMTMPADWLFVNRLQWGLYSVLAHLKAKVDYAGLFREALDSTPQPLEK